MAPGEYVLTAVDDADAQSPSIPVSLHPGEEVHYLLLELEARGEIRGELIDAD